MRLIINQIVSEEDKEAIQKGVFGDVIDCMDLSDFEYLRKTVFQMLGVSDFSK